MKKIIFLIIAFLATVSLTLNAQTYVNKEWTAAHGAPDSIEWSASTHDNQGYLITTSNTLMGGGHADVLLTKLDGEGSTIWQQTWDGAKNKSDYGTAVVTDGSGNIFVAAASQYSNDSIFDIVLLKYNSSGTLQWATNFDGTGGADYPVKMAIDQNSSIYITGTSEGSTSGYDFITLKYDDSGNLIWYSSYDYNQHVDIAADIVVDENGDNITVTGGSEDSVGIWDYTTVILDAAGNITGVDREPSSEADIKKPKDIVKDGNKNYYITGVQHNGTNNDIKLIKLDSTLQTQWVQVYNSANEGSNALAIDDNGNLYVAGWKEEGPNYRQFLTLCYNNNGTLQWQQTLWPDENKPLAQITDIRVENNEVLNVIGFTTDGNNTDVITAQYNLDGELNWTQTFENSGSSIDYPSSVEQIGDDVYVTGRTDDMGTSKWVTIKYSYYEPDNSVVYTQDEKPLFVKNQLIVRFDTSAIVVSSVNNSGNKNAEFGELSYFLKPAVVDNIQDKLMGICEGDCSIMVLKIFKDLKTTDTIATSRLNEQIPIPPFWATFVLEFTEDYNLKNTADSLASLFPLIKYVHPNVIGTNTSVPDDTRYGADQASLHSTSSYANAHINVEPAWNFTTGESFVRIGVFDDGVSWEHPDFGYNGTDPKSSKINGWDFGRNRSLKSIPGFGFHGTPCMGIIGAQRNNNLQVAGIAGGNDSIGNKGCSLFGMNIYNSNFYGNPLNYLANAYITSAILDTSQNYAYGLHIMSNSWRFDSDSIFKNHFTDTNLTLLRESINFINRQNVTFVAGRGNEGYSNKAYPAVTDREWVLCVGGTGTDANFIDKTTGNGTFTASTGWEIDVAAPAATQLTLTTRAYQYYTQLFGGTSAATPHVAGVAALLMSYLDSAFPSNDNLAPEDISHILEMTAKDANPITYPGKDSLTGYGLIDAGAALEAVNKNYRTVKHYGTGVSYSTVSVNPHSTNDTIKISEHYRNKTGTWYRAGKYIVDTYKASSTVYHSPFTTPISDNIIAYWPRHSSSNLLPIFDSKGNLLPRERVSIISLNKTTGSLEGYLYRVSDTLGNFLGWWPFDNTPSNTKFAYTILQEDPNYTSLQESVYIGNHFKVYPNPTVQNQNLVLQANKQENLEIYLYDLSGRLVLTVYKGKSHVGEQGYNVNVSSLSNGLYIYQVILGSESHYLKMIKQ